MEAAGVDELVKGFFFWTRKTSFDDDGRVVGGETGSSFSFGCFFFDFYEANLIAPYTCRFFFSIRAFVRGNLEF